MAQRLRIGGVQDVARVAIHHNVGIGRRTGRLADKKAERGSKTENAPTKPVAGSRPEPQHDYFPRPRLGACMGRRHPSCAEAEALDEAKEALFWTFIAFLAPPLPRAWAFSPGTKRFARTGESLGTSDCETLNRQCCNAKWALIFLCSAIYSTCRRLIGPEVS